jgi:hypothetical protein
MLTQYADSCCPSLVVLPPLLLLLLPQVSKKRSKNAGKPAQSLASSVSKKNGRRVLKSVAKEVAGYRPDLKVGAAAAIACVC